MKLNKNKRGKFFCLPKHTNNCYCKIKGIGRHSGHCRSETKTYNKLAQQQVTVDPKNHLHQGAQKNEDESSVSLLWKQSDNYDVNTQLGVIQHHSSMTTNSTTIELNDDWNDDFKSIRYPISPNTTSTNTTTIDESRITEEDFLQQLFPSDSTITRNSNNKKYEKNAISKDLKSNDTMITIQNSDDSAIRLKNTFQPLSLVETIYPNGNGGDDDKNIYQSELSTPRTANSTILFSPTDSLSSMSIHDAKRKEDYTGEENSRENDAEYHSNHITSTTDTLNQTQDCLHKTNLNHFQFIHLNNKDDNDHSNKQEFNQNHNFIEQTNGYEKTTISSTAIDGCNWQYSPIHKCKQKNGNQNNGINDSYNSSLTTVSPGGWSTCSNSSDTNPDSNDLIMMEGDDIQVQVETPESPQKQKNESSLRPPISKNSKTLNSHTIPTVTSLVSGDWFPSPSSSSRYPKKHNNTCIVNTNREDPPVMTFVSTTPPSSPSKASLIYNPQTNSSNSHSPVDNDNNNHNIQTETDGTCQSPFSLTNIVNNSSSLLIFENDSPPTPEKVNGHEASLLQIRLKSRNENNFTSKSVGCGSSTIVKKIVDNESASTTISLPSPGESNGRKRKMRVLIMLLDPLSQQFELMSIHYNRNHQRKNQISSGNSNGLLGTLLRNASRSVSHPLLRNIRYSHFCRLREHPSNQDHDSHHNNVTTERNFYPLNNHLTLNDYEINNDEIILAIPDNIYHHDVFTTEKNTSSTNDHDDNLDGEKVYIDIARKILSGLRLEELLNEFISQNHISKSSDKDNVSGELINSSVIEAHHTNGNSDCSSGLPFSSCSSSLEEEQQQDIFLWDSTNELSTVYGDACSMEYALENDHDVNPHFENHHGDNYEEGVTNTHSTTNPSVLVAIPKNETGEKTAQHIIQKHNTKKTHNNERCGDADEILTPTISSNSIYNTGSCDETNATQINITANKKSCEESGYLSDNYEEMEPIPDLPIVGSQYYDGDNHNQQEDENIPYLIESSIMFLCAVSLVFGIFYTATNSVLETTTLEENPSETNKTTKEKEDDESDSHQQGENMCIEDLNKTV